MLKVPEKNRVKNGLLKSDSSFGCNGNFVLFINGSKYNCIVSDGMGWEHVSISKSISGRFHMPTWDDMCMIKNIFWDEEDAVMQFHPPKSEYVNNHNYILHLWRESGINPKLPPSIMVGIK